MPTVEKTSGGRVYLRALDQRFEVGDRVDVNAGLAEYLCDERGDFSRIVEKDGTTDQGDDPPDEAAESDDLAAQIDAGECPWCDDYEGDGVPQHAASAHPDEWDAYKED